MSPLIIRGSLWSTSPRSEKHLVFHYVITCTGIYFYSWKLMTYHGIYGWRSTKLSFSFKKKSSPTFLVRTCSLCLSNTPSLLPSCFIRICDFFQPLVRFSAHRALCLRCLVSAHQELDFEQIGDFKPVTNIRCVCLLCQNHPRIRNRLILLSVGTPSSYWRFSVFNLLWCTGRLLLSRSGQ